MGAVTWWWAPPRAATAQPNTRAPSKPTKQAVIPAPTVSRNKMLVAQGRAHCVTQRPMPGAGHEGMFMRHAV
jgi:hypothetical protein